MTPPPRGKQPKNRLPKDENERIIEETIRRIRLLFPGMLGTYLPGVIAGGGGLPTRMLHDDGTPMIHDDGSPMYVG